jgi:hypothetical protein
MLREKSVVITQLEVITTLKKSEVITVTMPQSVNSWNQLRAWEDGIN